VEERSGAEVTHLWGQRLTPDDAAALNLAFDVTPNDLIAGIITEGGVARPPYASSLKALRRTKE
jgi:methylthioribose-1-phosphate isomerase